MDDLVNVLEVINNRLTACTVKKIIGIFFFVVFWFLKLV